MAERVVRSRGLEIFDVQFRRESIGWVLRVIIDRPGTGGARTAGGAPEEAVGVADCQHVSGDISAILDVEDLIDRAYTLEVSSPGLDRRLRHLDDFRRFAGCLAKVVVGEPLDGQAHFEGRLEGVDGKVVLMRTGKTKVVRIPVSAITRARLEVEF
ncbi:MAG: ribosome maturation factor RimP [Acidobacteria bacterium]|nr:ribosome maturation factor RimP [Acidobacteriota bacterium]